MGRPILVHKQPVNREYFVNSRCSLAWIFNLALILSVIIVPYFVAYLTNSFFVKESTFTEQPKVSFKHQALGLVSGSTLNGKTKVWSTSSHLTSLFAAQSITGRARSWTVDSNSDGINEEIWYETEFDVASGQSIQDVQLILFLEYKLSSRVQLTMESMVVVNGQNAAGGGVLSFDGTLSFDQKSLLPPLGRRSIYNAKLFEEKNVTSVRDFNMANIIFNAYQRNDTTSLTPLITTWQPGPAGKPFTVRGVIRIPPTVHRYQPGVIETLKFAWIQYLSLALVFYWILDVIKRFAYTERLVEAHIKDPINLAMNRKRK